MPALLSNTLHPATDGAAALYSTVQYSAVQYIAALYGEPAWAVLAGRGEIVTMEIEPIDVHFIENWNTRDWLKQIKHTGTGLFLIMILMTNEWKYIKTRIPTQLKWVDFDLCNIFLR